MIIEFLKQQILILLGTAALLLASCNIMLSISNRQMQQDVNARQQYIQQSQQLEPIYRELVNALANLAETRNDKQLRELLGAQGIFVSPSQPAQSPKEQPKAK